MPGAAVGVKHCMSYLYASVSLIHQHPEIQCYLIRWCSAALYTAALYTLMLIAKSVPMHADAWERPALISVLIPLKRRPHAAFDFMSLADAGLSVHKGLAKDGLSDCRYKRKPLTLSLMTSLSVKVRARSSSARRFIWDMAVKLCSRFIICCPKAYIVAQSASCASNAKAALVLSILSTSNTGCV